MLRRAPFAHVGKWMPDQLLIGFDQSFRVPFSHEGFGVRRHVAALKAQRCLRTPKGRHSLIAAQLMD